jgi:hypothetical protein
MSETLELVLDLIKRKNVLVSDHGYDELVEDDIFVSEILDAPLGLSWLKITLATLKDRVFSCYRRILRVSQSM